MIISQKVEKPVQGELLQLTNLTVAQFFRLAACGVQRDRDLAEQSSPRGQQVAVRAGKHIGGLVQPQITQVELTNPVVAGDQHVDLGVLPAEPPHTTGDHPPQSLSRWS